MLKCTHCVQFQCVVHVLMYMAVCPSESAVVSISVDCNVQGNCVCEKDTS